MERDVGQVWQQVHERLRVFISRRVSNQEETEDILQDVFLRIHRRLDSLKDPRRLVSWIYQIARHAIADHYRAPARQRELPAGLANDIEIAHPVFIVFSAEGTAESDRAREEIATCLRPMIARLSDQYRKALTLVELDGLTQAAAAKRLGLSVSGMKSRVQRGRVQLKRMLNECCAIQLDPRRRIAEYTVREPQRDPCGLPDRKLS